ncbi:hypothetical protein WJX73_009388 [Symbiochloris irregularis]|uniref:Enoyl-CoA hydratase n=1 Tax=Symbiochloris irregularis TaxID=706552 RepID=A0AAW1NVK3_9CHLO
MPDFPGFKTLQLSESPAGCAHLQLARPRQGNAIDDTMWTELPKAFHWLNAQARLKAVILSGQGKNFCTGIDLAMAAAALAGDATPPCPDHQHLSLIKILQMQGALSAIEACRWPVVAAIHGACIGAGVDMAAACDLRFCTHTATFCVKEVDLAIVADMGTLQRLPTIIGHGAARELCLTGRQFHASEAHHFGLVTRVLLTDNALMTHVADVAASLAAKSPWAITGTKQVLLHARDHSVEDGLQHVALYNAARLPNAEVAEAFAAIKQRRPPVYSKL